MYYVYNRITKQYLDKFWPSGPIFVNDKAFSNAVYSVSSLAKYMKNAMNNISKKNERHWEVVNEEDSIIL